MSEENVNKTSEMEAFANEFCEFRKKMGERTNGSAISNDEIITLYAIFRKDARTDRMNGNGNSNGFQKKPKSDPNAPATDKQKAAIEKFVKQGRTPSVNLGALKKKEASDIIGKVLGGGEAPSLLPHL